LIILIIYRIHFIHKITSIPSKVLTIGRIIFLNTNSLNFSTEFGHLWVINMRYGNCVTIGLTSLCPFVYNRSTNTFRYCKFYNCLLSMILICTMFLDCNIIEFSFTHTDNDIRPRVKLFQCHVLYISWRWSSSAETYRKLCENIIYNNTNHGSTALYGLGPPLSEVTGSCAFVAVGVWTTGRAAVLSILMCTPEPSGRQSGDLVEKWPQFCLRNISFHARKVCENIILPIDSKHSMVLSLYQLWYLFEK
jgi:hypothetical protein